MRKSFLTLTMVFLGLFAGVNNAWADDPIVQPIYLTTLQVQNSGESTGSGLVQLTWVDIHGDLFDNESTNILNAANPSEQAAQVALTGCTLFATESLETDKMSMGDHLYMTPFCYYKADAVGNNGSYFSHWTFNDPKITRQDTAMDKTAPNSAYFKVIPNSTDVGTVTIDGETIIPDINGAYISSTTNPNNIYAVFKKYLLSNPTASSKNVLQQKDATETLDVYVDVEGDMSQMKADYADFATPSFSDADAYSIWECDFASPTAYEVISANKRRYHFVVTYTALEGITEGKHSAKLTISMAGAGASSLNISVSVMARPASANDASVKIGDAEPTEYETLSTAVSAANAASGDITLTLLRNVSSAIELTNSMTLDMNGYTLNNTLTVNGSGKTVTLAYNKLGGEISDVVSVMAGTLVLNGSKLASLSVSAGAIVEQNGATIAGTVSNAGSFTTIEGVVKGGLRSTAGTLTINGGTFYGTNAVEVTGSTTANINKGTLNGVSCGLLVSGGTANVKKLVVINSEGLYSAKCTAGTLNVESGKFNKPLDGSINFTSGYFMDTNYGVSTEGKIEMLVSAGVEYNEGYRYFIGTAESAVTNGVGVCRIGTTSYATLEDALAYANNNPNEELVIFMTNNYTLPAGYYTLPAKATLVVPMSDSQAKEVNQEAPRVSYNDVDESHPYIQPVEFRRLTFANGVNLEVFGEIELTCTQFASNEAYTSQPVGPYGRLVMEEGSHMTLQDGSEFRAWGFMTGAGETDARRGSKVREMFQMGDWKGAMTSVFITGMGSPLGLTDYSDRKIFPVTQYFIQNVESPVKYHPGAVLSTSAAVSEGVLGMGISMAATDIKIVGVSGSDEAIFLMGIAADADNTWVRKWYDAEHDIQVYDINSGAHIGSMVLDMGELSLMGMSVPVRLNSAEFDLPITTNMKIHLLTGGMDFEQNTSLLPGSEVEVDKESVVSVAMSAEDKAKLSRWRAAIEAGEEPNPVDTVLYTGALYVYDADQWGKYAFCRVNGEPDSKAYTKVVRYAPSWEGRGSTPGKPDVRNEQVKPNDAAINVHGTFDTDEGYVYTSASGANIFSSNEDAGTFIFNQAASLAGARTVYQIEGEGRSDANYIRTVFSSAKLQNADLTYATTTAAEAGDAYCYIDGRWTIMKVDEDDDCFMVDNYGSFYAKPSEYVAIVATKDPSTKEISGNEDHTFSDAAGAGRLFILAKGEDGEDCQWWEVEQRDNLYYCAKNDMCYEYDDGYETWVEKTFSITWKNWDGSIVQTAAENGTLVNYYVVKYGTMAEFLGTNPTREATVDYTYDFTGWIPDLGPVTQDVTYTATYTQKERKYTIIFLNEGGSEIERQFLTHNEVPVCENTPTKVGHILQWTPAISPVIKDQTYTATWLEEPPTTWEVTFADYDGTVLKKNDASNEDATFDVPVNGTVSAENLALVPTPTKKQTDQAALENKEYNYEFDHWQPAITDPVIQPTIYTAVYREVAKTYTVIFQNENGTEIERHDYPYGATPVCSATPTKDNTAQYTYSFTWTPQIQTVQGAATYRAEFTPTTNKYTVTLIANPAGACTFSGAGVYEYEEEVNIAAIFDSGKYRFLNWSDDETNAVRATQTVSDNITLTAYLEAVLENDLEIGVGEIEELTGPTTKENLIITSNGVTSGQLINANNLILTGDAFFDITPAGGFDARKWYAVAVPWQVNTTDGILINGVSQNVGTDLDVLYYNGSQRATAGKGNNDWNRIENEVDKTMYPGTLYMIYLAHSASTIRFKKAAGVNILTTTLSVEAHPSAITTDAGWNGIANPALYHGYIDPDATTYTKHNFGQKYKPDQMSYDAVDMASAPMIVGEPIFVQVAASNAITVATSNPFSAPALRRSIVDNAYYEVQISAGEDYTDRIYLQTLEDKEDTYVIGLDLAKAGVSTKVAQMWVDRYNTKLCVNTTAPVGSSATYPLGIFVPQDGNYQIYSATEMQAGQEMFVTRNGHTIWNLAYGPYTATLSAGTNNEYGLKLIQVPAATTGIDPVTNDQLPMTNKVVIDDHVYIIRDGEIYTVTGQKIQ